jgi:hypothetical protein
MTVTASDRNSSRRAALEHEIACLRGLHWGDPSDVDLLDRITKLKAELTALDHAGTGGAA